MNQNFGLLVERHPGSALNAGTPNLVKILCSTPSRFFGAVVSTDSAGKNPVPGPWDALPTLSLFKPSALVPGVGLGLLDSFFFRLQNSTVLRFLRQHEIKRLFIMVASNPRFAAFAAHLPDSISKDLYLVDNFVEESYRYKMKRETAQRVMDSLMARSERVFTVSPASAEDLTAAYHRPCKFLPIPVPEGLRRAAQPKDADFKKAGQSMVIHHAGTVHHLYGDAMAQFIRIMSELAERKNREITIEFWGSIQMEDLEKTLDMKLRKQTGNLNVKICGPVSAEQLIVEQKRADFVLLVNSFSKSLKPQLRYSFSSKTIEYMLSGTPILLYGPSYSAVVGYLKAHQAAHIVCAEQYDTALKVFEGILFAADRHETAAAARLLAQQHSIGSFITKIAAL